MDEKRILVVDDDNVLCEILKGLFKKKGYYCATTPDIVTAMELVGSQKFDLAICDIKLPNGSGLDLLCKLRESYPETAVIMITALDDPEKAATALDLGISGYLIKPFPLNQVLIVVENALRKQDLENQEKEFRSNLEYLVFERTSELEGAIERLRESESQFRNLIEGSVQGILIFRGLKALFANQAFADIYGYSRDEVLEMETVLAIIPPEKHSDADEVINEFNKENKIPFHTVLEGIRKDGQRIWLDSLMIQIYWEGEPAIQFTCSDITRRKLHERELKENEQKFRTITELANDAIIMTDSECHISYWNAAAEKIFNYSKKEVMGRLTNGLIFYDNHYDAFKKLEGLRQAERFEDIRRFDVFAVRKGGAEFPIEISLSSVPLKGKIYTVAVVRDISERKKAERNLIEAHHELETILSGISSILICISNTYVITTWNKVAELQLGAPASTVLGKRISECAAEWEWDKIDKGIAACLEKMEPVIIDDVRTKTSDSRERFLRIVLSPIKTVENESDGILLMGDDVTDRKKLEFHLMQSQKLESIGQLAAGIAHEINTPIQYVGDNIHFIQDSFSDMDMLRVKHNLLMEYIEKDLPTDNLIQEIKQQLEATEIDYLEEEIPKALEQALDGVERVSKIVRSMKDFSHPGTTEKTAVDLNKALDSTITISRNEWKYVAEMETDFDDSLPLVQCLPGEINQVFLNLITNAAHAIKDVNGNGNNEKGKIRISTRCCGNSVDIRFTDTGCGIPAHLRHRIFDPFFTTKEVGKGTGQGLSISRSMIVDKHGGAISFESEEGKGSTFIIQLPIGQN
ncbi:conserved hypothetical protein [uncultured Desulfobacterium sp.]|uniref:histidine kinase n=1 Tax=uncultured Desulfobacterium sp. TaxID=201089 RepID=A0A445MXG7_9BACT|nr:conserved hypothetical protein [uncultured Desulfobacterium sp.]